MIGEVVLCTVPGFPPWPATIFEIKGQTISVEFFSFPLHKTVPNVNGKYEIQWNCRIRWHTCCRAEKQHEAITDGRKYFSGFMHDRTLDALKIQTVSLFFFIHRKSSKSHCPGIVMTLSARRVETSR